MVCREQTTLITGSRRWGDSGPGVMGTHQPGILQLQPGWSVVSSLGPGTEPSFGLRSGLSTEGKLGSLAALAAGSTLVGGERGEPGTKVPSLLRNSRSWAGSRGVPFLAAGQQQ